MKTAKKVFLTIGVLIICGFWCWEMTVANFFAQNMIYDALFTTTLDIYEDRWDIDFPKDAKIEYRYSTQGGFFGEGNNYAVVTFKKRPDEFLLTFTKENSQEAIGFFHSITDRLLTEGLDENKLVILNDHFIFKKLDKYNNHDILVMAYDEDTNKLYYIEELK